MNLWTCSFHGCTSTAVGCGGAVGLIAVGWYFKPGYTLLCPVHRPDASIPPAEFSGVFHTAEQMDTPCSLCTGDVIAAQEQAKIWIVQGFHDVPTDIFYAARLVQEFRNQRIEMIKDNKLGGEPEDD